MLGDALRPIPNEGEPGRGREGRGINMDTVPLICTKPVLLSLLHSFAFYFLSLSFCTITSHLAPLVIIVAADLSMFPSGVAVPYQWFFFCCLRTFPC